MTRKELVRAKAGISIRLRETRKAQGLIQEELAAEANTNQAVIQKSENGKSGNPRKVEDLALALSMNLAWLLRGEPFAEVEI